MHSRVFIPPRLAFHNDMMSKDSCRISRSWPKHIPDRSRLYAMRFAAHSHNSSSSASFYWEKIPRFQRMGGLISTLSDPACTQPRANDRPHMPMRGNSHHSIHPSSSSHFHFIIVFISILSNFKILQPPGYRFTRGEHHHGYIRNAAIQLNRHNGSPGEDESRSAQRRLQCTTPLHTLHGVTSDC